MNQFVQKSRVWVKGVPTAALLGAALLVGMPATAEVYPEELVEFSSGALISQATQSLSDQKYGDAVVYLKEYLLRMDAINDPRTSTMKQKVRLKLAKVLSYQENTEASIDYLTQYTEGAPVSRPREAFKLLAVNLFAVEEYEQCIAAATYALTEPQPTELVEEAKKESIDDMSKDDLGGMSKREAKRYEKMEAKANPTADLSEGLTKKDEAEPNYSIDELVLLNMTLAESCTKLEDYKTSVAPYKFVIENAQHEDRRGFATMQLVKALIALKEFEEVKTFIVQLCNTDARYDIRVNMALMSTGAALVSEGQLDSALMIYRMIMPRSEMVLFQERKMNEIRQKTGLPDIMVQVVTNVTGKAETIFGYRQSNLAAVFKAQESQGQLPPKPLELTMLEESVGAIVGLPPYENDVLYRVGQLYAAASRPWEAVTALDMVANNDPEGERGERAFAESLSVLVSPLEEYALVEKLGRKYLADHTEGIGPRMVVLALTSSYQKRSMWADVKKLRPLIAGLFPSEDSSIRQYDCELAYMQAIADMMLLDYNAAQKGFANILVDYPVSHQQENATHWQTMCSVFLQQYSQALAGFESYPELFPRGHYLPTAAFHRGICLFALERYEEAEQQYTYVIKTFPDATVYSDACAMRADLLASKSKLDAAQADYEEAIRTARNEKQDAYAVFQMSAMFELEERYDEIIGAVNAYLERNSKKADVAKAAYWIGKTKMAQGLVDEAVEAYRSTIVKYGGDVQQQGVDMIISELVKVARRMDAEPLAQLKSSLQGSVAVAKSGTLKLRLRVLLADMDDTKLELGRQLIKEVQDLEQAPPPVLAVICDASFDAGDYSRSEEILKIFQTRFEESDFMRAAYKLRGFDLYGAENYEAALKIIKETQELYGTDEDAAWAQLMRGRIELKQARVDAARDTFRAILNVRDWRGETFAEANFSLGLVEENAGNLTEAFGWYQRTYIQYKGYANGYWAAEGYLASARVLGAMGRENDRRNTFRAMLFDKYVNALPQADSAKKALGAAEVLEINTYISEGGKTNISVTIDAEVAQ